MLRKGLAGVGAFVVVAALLAACSSSTSRVETNSSSASPSHAATSSPDPAAVTSTTVATAGGATWTTYYGDSRRDGSSNDGPSASRPLVRKWKSPTLDGDVYAQPLVVGKRVIVATAQNTVYALSIANGHVAWRRHLATPVPNSQLPCGDVDPVGITGTPVVDPAAGRVYAVGMAQPAHHELWVLDLATGRLIASQRVDVPGSDPKVQNQRSALALANHTIYVPYGGRFGDCGDYHGRVESVAVTSSGLGAQRSYTLPTQREGGFWSPPGTSVASDGSLYIASGNSSSNSTYDYGNTVVRLSPTLKLLDSFAPTNWAQLNAGDTDIGSTSPALLTNGRLFQIGKSGTGYLLDTSHLGGIGGELASRSVCPTSAFGGVAHRGRTLFVPCTDGVQQVVAGSSNIALGWKVSVSTPGPPVIAGNLVWTVVTSAGVLNSYNLTTGRRVSSATIGSVPSRFVSPAVGGGLVIAAGARQVSAIGN